MILREVGIFLKCMSIPLMENIHELLSPPHLATRVDKNKLSHILITYSFIRHLEL